MNDREMSPREFLALSCNAEVLEEQAVKLGRMMRQARRNAMLSVEQLAAHLNLPVSHIAGWERGEVIVTQYDVFRMANIVGWVGAPKPIKHMEDAA